ncbi:MAG TPA: Clp protease N-terminal domain-containing protein [Micromonosporaceae bacterium]
MIMFERFTFQAREAVTVAAASARGLGHPHLGTEHLLLGLVESGGGAGQALRDAGLGPASVRQAVVRYAGGSSPFDDLDAQALRSIGIDLDAIRARLEDAFGPEAVEQAWTGGRGGSASARPGHGSAAGPGDGSAAWPGDRSGRIGRDRLPFTARAKKVLQLALREAIRLRHGFLGPEHILLGILRDGRGLAAMIISDAGIDPSDLRRRIVAGMNQAA